MLADALIGINFVAMGMIKATLESTKCFKESRLVIPEAMTSRGFHKCYTVDPW